jgi:hypothetical protein
MSLGISLLVVAAAVLVVEILVFKFTKHCYHESRDEIRLTSLIPFVFFFCLLLGFGLYYLLFGLGVG